MKKLLLISLMIMAFIINVHAQTKLEISNVISIELRNTGPIIEDHDVKGYYIFFQSDKIDKKTNEYTLRLTDQNLNNAKDIKFEDSKDIQLLESSYNGDGLMFTFYDQKAKTLENRLYGMDGKLKNTFTRDLDKRSQEMIVQFYSLGGEKGQNKALFAIEKNGFISVYPIREKKQYIYEINYYSTASKKQWTYSPEEGEKRENAVFLGATDSIAVFEVLKFERLLSKKSTSFITGFYLNNGKIAFEVPTTDSKYKLYPMNMAKLDSSSDFVLMGSYYDNDDRIMADKTLGLATWRLSSKGKTVSSNYSSWENDFSKFLNINDKGKIDDIGYLYIHNILETNDGNFYAIGEGYKKSANAMGIAMNIGMSLLNHGASYSSGFTKIDITDLVLLKLNNNFKVTGATIYNKNKNSIDLGTATDVNSGPALAAAIKVLGGFDYRFTQSNKDKSTFVVGYTDYVKSSDYKGLTFNSITCNNNTVTTDKIELKSKATSTEIYPAKTGSVLVVDYFKKDKKLEAHMEKLN